MNIKQDLFKSVIGDKGIRLNIFEWVHWITIRVTDRPLTCYTRQSVKRYNDIINVTLAKDDDENLVRLDTNQLAELIKYKIQRNEYSFPITQDTLIQICSISTMDESIFRLFLNRNGHLFTKYNLEEIIQTVCDNSDTSSSSSSSSSSTIRNARILYNEFKDIGIQHLESIIIKKEMMMDRERHTLEMVNTIDGFESIVSSYHKRIKVPRESNQDNISKDLLNSTLNRLCNNNNCNNSQQNNIQLIFKEINEVIERIIKSLSSSSTSNFKNPSYIWINLIVLRVLGDQNNTNRLEIVKNIIKNNTNNEIVEYLFKLENELCLENWVFDILCKHGTFDQVVFGSKLIGTLEKKASYKAMDWAANKGRLDVVQYLLDHRKEQCSQTAVQGNPHSDVVRLILQYKPTLMKFVTRQSILVMGDIDFLQELDADQLFGKDQSHSLETLVISRTVAKAVLTRHSQLASIRMIDYLFFTYTEQFPVYDFISEACMLGLEQVVYHLHHIYSTHNNMTITPHPSVKTTIFDDAFLYGMNQNIVDFLIDNRKEGFGPESWKVVGQNGTVQQFEMLKRWSLSQENMDIMITNSIRYGNIDLYQYIKSNIGIDETKFKVQDLKYAARLYKDKMVLLGASHLSLQDLNDLLFHLLCFGRTDIASQIYQQIIVNNNNNNNNNHIVGLTENQINYLIKRFDHQVVDFLVENNFLNQSFVDSHRFKLCHPSLYYYQSKYLSKYFSNFNNISPIIDTINNNNNNIKLQNNIKPTTTINDQIIILKVLKNRYLLRRIFRLNSPVASVYKQFTFDSLISYRPKLLLLLLKANQTSEIIISKEQLEDFCCKTNDLELFKLVYSRFRSRFSDNFLFSKMVYTRPRNLDVFKILANQTDPVLEYNVHQIGFKCSDAALYLYNLKRLPASMVHGPFGTKYFNYSKSLEKDQYLELLQLEREGLDERQRRATYNEDTPLEFWQYHNDQNNIKYYAERNLSPKILEFRLYHPLKTLEQSTADSLEGWQLTFSYYAKESIATLYHLVKGYEFTSALLRNSSVLAYLINEQDYFPSPTGNFFSSQPPSHLLSKYYLPGMINHSITHPVSTKEDLFALLYMNHDVLDIYRNIEQSGSRIAIKHSTLTSLLIANIQDQEQRTELVSSINPTMFMPIELLQAIVDCYMETDTYSLPILKHFLGPKLNETKMADVGFDMIGLIKYTFASARNNSRTCTNHRFTRIFIDHLLVYTLSNCSIAYVLQLLTIVRDSEKEVDRLVGDALSSPNYGSVRQLEFSKISDDGVYQFFFARFPCREEYLFAQPYINHPTQYSVVKQVLLDKDPKDYRFIIYALKYAYRTANVQMANEAIQDCIYVIT
ncbi:hypothetical protein DFA_04771 [Cavenderia fasciculata]|uniref:Ankyrin repeat-containing protein n=1 Tax=Cavenderia fasciculata TaxID=261658 RepID=F4PQH8_CACFS|nr:uncharacterized protein DFA_04771 [Cavenderia fasciculata]EGG22641.1 hypothetical protein DFA_04771 [Cavenderia fasciculata]|eukprot:XP_004360492.1 hypothetical protein DFA_04771 [Cavenderia fasciculata]